MSASYTHQTSTNDRAISAQDLVLRKGINIFTKLILYKSIYQQAGRMDLENIIPLIIIAVAYLFKAFGDAKKRMPGKNKSEERREGKECVSTCRPRGSQYHTKKKKTKNR